ncbi:putative Ig domain-containing protein [Gemmatimonadota bacterium]
MRIKPVIGLLLGLGFVCLTAGLQSCTDTVVVVVEVAQVDVSPSSPSIVVGQTTQLAAVPRDAGGNQLFTEGRQVTWSSGGNSIATVDSNGLVTAVFSGEATISVRVDGITGTATISVTGSITTNSLAGGVRGAAYSQTLVATGGTGSYVWSLAGGGLPVGLSLSSSGVISGIPSQAGTFTFTVQVVSGGATATKELSIAVVNPPLEVSTTALDDGYLGIAYHETLTAAGGSGSYVWSLAGGSLPAGLSLSSSGIISGRPTQVGTNTFTVQVESGGATDTAELSITVVNPALEITTTALPPANLLGVYNATLEAIGGTGSYVWSLVGGSFPAGLGLSTSGTISGVPTQTGTGTFRVQVASGGETATKDLSISVVTAALEITTTALPRGSTFDNYSVTLEATGGIGGYVWTLVEGTLPSALTLSPSGIISGFLWDEGTYSFTVQVASGGATARMGLSIVCSLFGELGLVSVPVPSQNEARTRNGPLQSIPVSSPQR